MFTITWNNQCVMAVDMKGLQEIASSTTLQMPEDLNIILIQKEEQLHIRNKQQWTISTC